MRTLSDPRPAVTFDPFGEPVADGVARVCTSNTGDRVARQIGGAVFWGLALLILAGRIYVYDVPLVSQVASYATQLVAMR
ncbi:hypothetical protein [Methylobacterium sp. WL116]|uniref:hypothetical protein n=1 Tax=Methylobacterium sp. WL116 TaxID=2603889 RepID=UPI0011CB0735|nr:hypothetical protein [Methylobacterium sp. WL116]TXM95053.1 hypothetical protein FV223_02335 [Methylobacterium sp. WL116]